MEEGDGEIPLPAVCKNTALLDEINEELSWSGLRMETNEEYVSEHLAEMLAAYAKFYQLDEADFVRGKGRHKTIQQRHYECLQAYMHKLEEYREKLTICSGCRLRLIQQLPVLRSAWHEEVYEVHHARQEKQRQEIPENPYQAENFLIRTASCAAPTERHSISVIERTWTGTNTDGRRKCLNARIAAAAPVHLNAKKTPKNRTVRISRELTAMHREGLDNLNSIHGALLRMNRSIQAEGTFGVMKYDRSYKRIVRRGLNSVRLEVFRVSIGHNLYKLCSKTMKKLFAA